MIWVPAEARAPECALGYWASVIARHVGRCTAAGNESPKQLAQHAGGGRPHGVVCGLDGTRP